MVHWSFNFLSRDLSNSKWKKFCLGRFESREGQALLSWLLIVSLLLALIVATSSAQILLDHRLEMTQTCRKGGLQVQEIAGDAIKKILSLNPHSRSLRIRLHLAEAKLAQALISMNPALVALARTELAQVQNEQRQLDRLQKAILTEANARMSDSAYGILGKLNRSANEIKRKSSDWADLQMRLLPPRIPKIALQEEDRRLAPAYRPREDFESEQRLQFSWSQSYRLKGFFEARHNSTTDCQTTLEVNTWIPKIRKARPSSKWL